MIEELKLKIVVDKSELSKGISNTSSQVNKVSNNVIKAVDGVKSRITGNLAFVGASFVKTFDEDFVKRADKLSLKVYKIIDKPLTKLVEKWEDFVMDKKIIDLGDMTDSQMKLLGTFRGKVEDAENKISQSVFKISLGISKFIASIGLFIAAVIGAIAALVGITNKVAQFSDTIDKNSQRLNMSYEQYQKWDYIMQLCGGSIDDLKASYNQLTSKMASNPEIFESLGIDKNSPKLLEDTIIQLQKIEDITLRTAKAQEIFGRSANKLNPLLNMTEAQLKDVERTQRVLNATMSDDMVKSSAKYEDSITTMKQALQGLKNSIGEVILPILQKFVVWLTVAVAKINILIRALFRLPKSNNKNTVAGSMDTFTESTESAITAVKELKRQTLGFDEMNILDGDKSDDVSGGSDYDYDFEGIQANFGSLLPEDALDDIEKFEEKMDSIKNKVAGWVASIGTIGGALLTVIGLLSGNWGLAAIGIGVAGFSFAVGANWNWDFASNKIDNLKTAEEKLKKATEELADAQAGLIDAEINTLNTYDSKIAAEEKLREVLTKTGVSLDDLIRRVDKGTVSYETMTDAEKQVWRAYKDSILAVERYIAAKKTEEEQTIKAVKAEEEHESAVRNLAKSTADATGDWEAYGETIVKSFQQGKVSAEEAQKELKTVFRNMDADARKEFFDKIPIAVSKALDVSQFVGTKKTILDWFADLGKLCSNAFSTNAAPKFEEVKPTIIDTIPRNMTITEKLSQMRLGYAPMNINVNVDLDGKEVANSVITHVNDTTRRTGQSPILA